MTGLTPSPPDPSPDGWQDAQIPPETPLPSCPERSVGLSLPLPISARVDLLVALAEQAGERTSRKEIAAACILGAPDGAEEPGPRPWQPQAPSMTPNENLSASPRIWLEHWVCGRSGGAMGVS